MARFKKKRAINDIRLLSLDMINKAGHGHPGICLDAAPILYTLFSNHLKVDLEHKDWVNRDRFVMSAGHGSALLYASLFYIFDDYSVEDLKRYRTYGSVTPGHPVLDIDHRIEATTGLLGQGFATAVGMAIGEKHLEERFNGKKNILFDYNIYALVGDGDLAEGISYEAAALAGQLELNNLIVLYDANNVTSDTECEGFSDNIADMYMDLGWNVIDVKNGENTNDIDKAINQAKKSKGPSLIVVNNTLGIYSMNEGSPKVHCGRLSEEDLNQIREKLKGEIPFGFDKDNMVMCRESVKEDIQGNYEEWKEIYDNYIRNATDKEIDAIESFVKKEDITLKLENVIDIEKLFVTKTMRDLNYQVMNVIAAFVPNFMGGSADLVTSTKTYLKGKGNYDSGSYKGQNIRFGVREHAMGAIINGLALVGFRPFSSTFLAFSDYMKPAIRMGSIMDIPSTYIFTHDSIDVGTDGITHYPIEQLGSLRSIPNLNVYRPCDYKELIGSWNCILRSKHPNALVINKNHTESYKFTSIEEVKYGGYVISEVKTRLDAIVLASGAEVTLAMKLKEELLKNFIEVRVVSVPNLDLFLKQSDDYKEQVLPKKYKRIVLEYSNDANWYKLVNSKDDFINISEFVDSGNIEDILKHNNLDLSNLIIRIKENL